MIEHRVDVYAVLIRIYDEREISPRVNCTLVFMDDNTVSVAEAPLYLDATGNGVAVIAFVRRDTGERWMDLSLECGITTGTVVVVS